MTVVAVYLDRDRPPRVAEFRRLAEKFVSGIVGQDGALCSLHTGQALLELADQYQAREVRQLAIFAHGGPDWLINPAHGVRIARTNRGPDQVTVGELAEAWAPVLVRKPLISLAACLCSRSPSWWLRWRFGRELSPWGLRSYERGGEASFSARLRDELCWHDLYPAVRGHMSAGHATGNPLLREHRFPAASQGVPLFELATGGAKPTMVARRQWVQTVKGELAERWLLGDDRVVNDDLLNF